MLSVALAALAREQLFPVAPHHHALETADLSLFEELVTYILLMLPFPVNYSS